MDRWYDFQELKSWVVFSVSNIVTHLGQLHTLNSCTQISCSYFHIYCIWYALHMVTHANLKICYHICKVSIKNVAKCIWIWSFQSKYWCHISGTKGLKHWPPYKLQKQPTATWSMPQNTCHDWPWMDFSGATLWLLLPLKVPLKPNGVTRYTER